MQESMHLIESAKSRRIVLAFWFGLLHILLCAVIAVWEPAGDWWYVGVIDFPVGLACIMVAGVTPLSPAAVFGLVGTAWWAFLGYRLESTLNNPKSKRRLIQRFKPLSRFYVMPLIHFCLCVAAQARQSDWIWEKLEVVDFPVYLLEVVLGFTGLSPLFLFGVLGTLWWFGIAWLLANLFSPTRRTGST